MISKILKFEAEGREFEKKFSITRAIFLTVGQNNTNKIPFLVKCDFNIVFATLWRLIYAKIALKHVYNFGGGSFCKPVVILKRFFCVCFANHKGGMVQLPYNCQVGQPWGPIKCLILAINFSEIMTNKNNMQVKLVIVPIFIFFEVMALKNFTFKCLKQPTYFDHIFLYFPMIHKKVNGK